ncbi:Sensor protein ZraS [Rubripirellula lacrimiformis]|uniref:histidine kinase n=1 Tax=Rubripirellula lacrimiformis TaxID=1930273 RepID=A0A517NBP0_9BACT|nr:ATP-binding protein [Rubripirellula lacrimiformis]QDT04555.1 Sensor protein ZraS [Rubripirellula lacrimiformis]
MFDIADRNERISVRWFAAGLVVLGLVALTVTAWILAYVRREQEIVADLIRHLPASDLEAARELSGDLRLQGGLSILLVLNLIATAIAFTLLVRGYLNSERSLRDAKVLSADILASMDAGVITTDRDGSITSINSRGQELLGLAGDGIGTMLDQLDREHELLGTIQSDVSSNHQRIRDRDYLITRQGHPQTLRAGCTLLRNQLGEEIGTVLHVRDVTQKALIEEQLRRMERYMGLGSLAAGLQHEIKNPLSALSLHVQLLCERLRGDGSPDDTADVDPDVQEMLDVLRSEVRRINDVLDGFRNYASTNHLGRSELDVPELIMKLVRLLRPQTESQSIEIETEFSDTPVTNVMGDSVRLEQVLLNLAINAVSAMPQGGILRFAVDQKYDSLRIRVADTGHGISPEIRSQIFDPYFTTRGDGTGMGLALCDKIIQQHNGNIDVRTGSGGTEFTIFLPMEKVT